MTLPHVIAPFPTDVFPFTGITPFTYRNSLTYTRVLEDLIAFINRLVDLINESDEELYRDVIDKLNQTIERVNAALADQTADNDAKMEQLMRDVEAAIQLVLDASVETNDQIVDQILRNTNSLTVNRLNGMYQGLNTVSDTALVNMLNNLNSAFRKRLDTLYQGAGTVSDSALNTTIRNGDSLAHSAILDIVGADISEAWRVKNVLDFGADPSGATDSGPAFQAAVSGGGVVYIPTGTYQVSDMVRVGSDTRIVGGNAIIRKPNSPASAVCFALLGGSGTIRNIEISGLVFRGNAPTSSLYAMWAHRVNGLTVHHCRFERTIINGHDLDLQGCDNVTVHDTVHIGASPTADRAYVEAIQVDVSTRTGSPYPEITSEVYDGTPTRNVRVFNSRFLKDTGTRYAPRPIGSHSVVQDRFYDNITLEQCYIEEVAESANFPSIVTFVGGRNVTIRNNIFNVPSGKSYPYFVAFVQPTNAIAIENVNNTVGNSPISKPMLSMLNSVYGNRVSGGYRVNSREGTELPPIAPFILYGSGDNTGVFAYYRDGSVHVSGVVTLSGNEETSTANVCSNAGLTVCNLPEELRPLRDHRVICEGTGTAKYRLQIARDGRLIVSNYSVQGHTLPYICIDATYEV